MKVAKGFETKGSGVQVLTSCTSICSSREKKRATHYCGSLLENFSCRISSYSKLHGSQTPSR